MNDYNRTLIIYLIEIVIFLILNFSALFILIFSRKNKLGKRKKKSKQIKKDIKFKILFYVSWGIWFIISALGLKYSIDIGLDLYNQSYVTYRGDFYYKYDMRPYRRYVILHDNDNYKKLEVYFTLESGEYSGQIIYSKRSKIAVDYHIQKKLD